LGLSVSRRLVEEHHGSLLYISRPGVGTRFSVYLPLTGDAQANVLPALLWVGVDDDMSRRLRAVPRPSRSLNTLTADTEQEVWEILGAHPEVKLVVVNLFALGKDAESLLSKLTGHYPLLMRVVYGETVAVAANGGWEAGLVDAWLLPPLDAALAHSIFCIEGAYENPDSGRRTNCPEVTQTAATSTGH
ncbi:MAG: ATP-binding protein, partial [Deltaproteobacteria bacterium]